MLKSLDVEKKEVEQLSQIEFTQHKDNIRRITDEKNEKIHQLKEQQAKVKEEINTRQNQIQET